MITLMAILACGFMPTVSGDELLSEETIPVWRNLGPGGGGWIQAICASGQREEELLVGCDVGGFYRSTDGGASYTISNSGLRDDFVECIVPDPLDGEVIYLGCQSGVHRSTDRGETWQWLREGFPPRNRWDWSAPIGALAIDPQDPAVLYAGIGRPRWEHFGKGAIYKTVDRGEHWQQINASGSLPADALVTDLAVDPQDSRRLLMACQYGVYCSENGGVTWDPVVAGLPHPHVRRVAFCLGQPDVVYLTLWAKPGQWPWQGGVYKSVDRGVNWSPCLQGLPRYVGQPGQASERTANYDRLAVHPDNPDVVYVGGCSWGNADIYKTTNGGRTWAGTMHRGMGGNTEDGWITFWGPDVQCLSMSPFNPETLYFGTSGKVYKTTDGGEHWRQVYTHMLPDGRFQGTGLEVTCAVDVVVHPADPQRLYFCYLDIGLLISEDGGQSFRRGVQGVTPSAMQGNCYALVFDPANDAHCWASFGGGSRAIVAESYNGGSTWTTVGTTAGGLPDVPHRVLRVDAAGHLIAVADNLGVYLSEDSGRTWQPRGGGLPHGDVRGLVVDPTEPGRWWCALGDDGTNPGAVFRTIDAGRAWQRISHDLPVADVQRFLLAPSDPRRFYLAARDRYVGGRTYHGGVYRSDDRGVTWDHILPDDFVMGLAVDPSSANIVYAGLTDHPFHDESRGDGIRVTYNGGQTWYTPEQPTCLHISSITVDTHDPSQLYLSTGGNGVFVGSPPHLGPTRRKR